MANLGSTTQPLGNPLVFEQNSTPSIHGRKRARSVSELNIEKGFAAISLAVQPTQPRRRRRNKQPAPAFNAIPSETDPAYVDLPENEPAPGHAKSGPPPDQLARMITRPCYPSGEEPHHSNRYYRCIASSVCGWTQKNWDRQLPRIYRHAAWCKALRHWKPELRAAAEIALAGMAPGGTSQGLSQTADRTTSELHTEASPTNPFARFANTEQLSLPDQLNHAIARLICASGSPTRLVDYPEWSHIFALANPLLNYTPPHSSYVRDKLIPAEARRAVIHMREYLQTQRNLSLSFDGLTSGKQPIYTVHICTAERVTFLYHADIYYGSHNADYMVDFLEQVIEEIGPHRFASVVSDDTSTTKKARRVLTSQRTSILNLADPVHKINLCIQDICLDILWTRASTYSSPTDGILTCKLDAARKILGILRGLQSIGNTRFATIYYAAVSVLENLRALYKIYQDGDIDTVNTPLPDIVAEAIDESATAIKFRLMLTKLVNILEPFARALVCLESAQSTLADVYFFWLSALASLNQHFASNHSELTTAEKARIIELVLNRFNEAINDAPTDCYLTAFFLDPRYRDAAVYVGSNTSQLQEQPIAKEPERSGRRARASKQSSRLNEPLYMRIRKQLLLALRDELQTAELFPDHPLRDYVTNALGAKAELCDQLDVYYRAEKLPFRHSHGDTMTAVQYWRLQKEFQQTFILAYLAEKLFSVLPNSMCDERAGSRLTHLYSQLRTRLDARSMIEQIQFRQWDVLVHGTSSIAHLKKAQRVRRFQDISPGELPDNHSVGNSVEMSAALSDDVGDDWLETPIAPQVPEESSTPHTTLFGVGDIDLTSHMLLDALSTSPVPIMPKFEAGEAESSENGSQNALLPITRVGDIQWD
ncbi:hypothetical protein FRC12_001891 [Ceratobasidium sp. 428]|nr:hypothetical protein FRC12_001891 [Ceratobasidium sp. 428]